MPDDSESLILNCWVFGDAADRIFPVEIARIRTVGVLKKVIKAEKGHAFRDIDADTLDVFKLSMSIPFADFGAKLATSFGCQKNSVAKKLHPMDELSEHFSSPHKKDIHIIVERSPAGKSSSVGEISTTASKGSSAQYSGDARMISNLAHYLDIIEKNEESAILFYNKTKDLTINNFNNFTSSACNPITYYAIEACDHGSCKTCSNCEIMDYAEVERLPTALLFRSRVLMAEVVGGVACSTKSCPIEFAKNVHRELEDSCRRAASSRPLLCLEPCIFHIMNVMCFGAFSSVLRDLWHAQGVEVSIRRDIKRPTESWRRCFELKKEEWKATALMATFLSAAAATLLSILAMNNHPIPTLLCLISLICDLGSAISGTTLICCFANARYMRLAWHQGGVWFVMALSAPSGCMRWGIATFLGALLAFIWTTQPVVTKLVGTVLISTLFISFFVLPLLGQTFRVWGATQLFTLSLPLTPDSMRSYKTAKSDEEMA